MQADDAPACVPIEAVVDIPGWFICQTDANSSLLVAAATGATALIAWLAHRREKNRIEERTTAADARIAGLAYVVRRTLEKSLEDPWFEGDGKALQSTARELRPGFEEHEPRVENMLEEAPAATSEIAEDTRKASRLFWRAADGIGDAADASIEIVAYDATGAPQVHEMPAEAEEGFRRARDDVKDCVEVLCGLDAPIRESDG